jgi:hypothetical protein
MRERIGFGIERIKESHLWLNDVEITTRNINEAHLNGQESVGE